MKVLFFKGIRPGLAGVYSVGVKIWTGSLYSHCEILFNDGTAASSSFHDKGVRFIENFREHLDRPQDWDILELPDFFEAKARQWFTEHQGQGYDVFGNVHFVLAPFEGGKEKWFCSESIGAALGLEKPWRFDPGTLYQTLRWLIESFERREAISTTSMTYALT